MGLCPKPQFLFCLDTKKESKKVKATPASHEKRAFDGFPITRDKLACGSNRKDFLKPSSLVFRLTGRGRSVPRRILFILGKIQDIHIKINHGLHRKIICVIRGKNPCNP
jgi:hypothetical protein